MINEKETAKYKQALEFAIKWEKTLRLSGLDAKTLRSLDPGQLYRHIEGEWWQEWNGVLQVWESTRG